MAANMALTMTRKIEGPRLDDLKFTGGDYGTPLPMIWGMRRMQVPIFWADDLREVKQRRKTKGGKYNDYSYFGSWAVALAGHEIETVRRVWFDTHLVFDLSGAGPVTPFDFGGDIKQQIRAGLTEFMGANGKANTPFFSFYIGTETQEPNPLIEAWCNDRYGEGSAPAYRGTAYIVFKDIPLEKLGNRIPQVAVEIVGNASTLYPTEVVSGFTGTSKTFSYDYSLLLGASANSQELGLLDVAARTPLSSVEFSDPVEDNTEHFALMEDGRVLHTAEFGVGTHATDAISGAHSSGSGETIAGDGHSFSVMDGDGEEHWVFHSSPDMILLDGAALDTAAIFGHSFIVGTMFVDLDGIAWIVGRNHTTSTEAVFYPLSTDRGIVRVPGLPNDSATLPMAFHYRDSTNDHFVLAYSGDLYTVGYETGAVGVSNTALDHPSGLSLDAFCAIVPGASTFYVGFEELSSIDLTRVRLLDYRDWVGGVTDQEETVYDPVNHALIVGNRWCYLDRVGSAGVTLQTICEDVADDCGVEDYDFSDLTQTIPGWSATRGPASNMIEPLLDAYDSDFRPHDFTIQGLKRTGIASGGTLETEWFAGDPRYSVKVRQASELPRTLLIDFADTAAEQQPNSVRADRPLDATDARGEQKIDLTTLALDTDTARQLANRYFRRIWNERKEVSLALTAKELKLEPGDVRTLELDGDEADYRCTRVTIQADDKLATEWKYDHASLASLDGSTGATFDGRDEQTVNVPVLSKGFVLDIPLLTDSDDASVPQVYTLAGPYADGTWPGAIVYQAVDGEYSEELASVPSSSAATWGYVSAAMPYANPNLWDRGTEITVTLQTGELTGCTEAAANADPTLNLAAIGADGRWEIVQFTTATLSSGTTYTVSGFKRGRRGTEWAAELHEAGDVFVLLDTADAQAMGLSEVGTDVDFKAITAGRTTGLPFGYSYTGASLKPYAPAHLKAVKQSNGDWLITGTRRTRAGGAWTSGTAIPLSEDSEAYELDLGDGVTTVTKSVAGGGTGAFSYTWDVATQTSDTGAEVTAGNLTVAAYQISADVDRGFAAELTA